MSASQIVAVFNMETKPQSLAHLETVIGLTVGLGGGLVQSIALGAPIWHGLVVGGTFGVIFAIAFARRATSAGAGLIWGLAAAFLMWLVFPAGLRPLLARGAHSMGEFGDARDQFPLLVGYLTCLGMPVGLVTGYSWRFALRRNTDSLQLDTRNCRRRNCGCTRRFYLRSVDVRG